jgi:predicted Zn-dependent protease with MMP-like domain
MTRKKFEKLVKEGIKAIPKRFLKKLNNVVLVIEDEPISWNSSVFGLYEGIPQTKRSYYGQVLPDKITIFKKPIERLARSEEEIKKIVKNTVWHEIAHHFGMSEKQVKEKEYRRSLSEF